MTAEQFAATCRHLFQTAADNAGGARHRYYSVGPHTVRLSFAGGALLPYITPALAHISVEHPPKPELTIYLWDSASTRCPMPPPPWSPTAYGRRGQIEGFNNDHIYTFYEPGIGLLRVLDVNRGFAVFWVAHHERIPYWEHSFPLREIWHWWLRYNPRQLVHAGAVGLQRGGVLLAGKGGSGKSTTCLACLQMGLLYAGDDYVLIQTHPEPHVYSLYNIGKLQFDNLDRVPGLSSLVENPAHVRADKALLYVHTHRPEATTAGFPLKAILLPEVAGLPKTRLRPATRVAALAALAPTTLIHLPRGGREVMKKLRDFVELVPSYHLDLGTDVGDVARVITDFLKSP